MYCSLPKTLLTVLSAFNLFTLISANPVQPSIITPRDIPLSSIQTGDLCDPTWTGHTDPTICYFGTYGSKNYHSGSASNYFTSLYVFCNTCQLIGFNRGQFLVDNQFVLGSDLPEPIAVQADGLARVSFWYNGGYYDQSGNTPFTCWAENSGADYLCRFMFRC